MATTFDGLVSSARKMAVGLNARSLTIVALGFVLGTAVRRLGWKWTTVLCAVGFSLVFEQRRRLDRHRILQQRALQRARMQQMFPQDSVFMLMRDANGIITPIRPHHLALMLREGDFTAEDYEDLLRLDNELPRVKDTGASEDTISSLPVQTVEADCKLLNENCAICLEKFELGDKAKTMTCEKHVFHLGCLDDWLRVKATCPLCLTVCS